MQLPLDVALFTQAVRQRMQYKTFIKWINHHLKKDKETKLRVEDLKTDFADGIKLIKLIELISEEDLGRYNKKPISKFQKVENLNVPLAYINRFLKEQKIQNQYSAENILEENEVLILGMIWSLILRFAVLEVSEGEKTAKEGLMLWAQKKVDEASKGNVQVTNFHTSWQDGSAFCALIHAFRPDLVDKTKLGKTDDPASQTAKLNLAFDVAHEHLGIERMLDAQDMIGNRPDEKSVMTYISFFWKEFAGTKKKALAAEAIGRVVSREVEFEEMQQSFESQARALAAWIQERTALFNSGTEGTGAAELQSTLQEYLEYGATDRPAKIQALMDAEALHTSIASRLAALGRTYTPPDDCKVDALQRWWDELSLAERKYEEGIKMSLGGLKRMGGLVKLFHSKASKLDHWLATKAAWLQASHAAALKQLDKPPPELIALPPSSPGRGTMSGKHDTTMNDSVPPPPITPEGRKRANTTAATEAVPQPNLDDAAPEMLGTKKRSVSVAELFGDLFSAIADNFAGEGGNEGGESGEGVQEGLTLDERLGKDQTPSKTALPALTTQKSLDIFTEELSHENARQAEAGDSLNSVSAALAKINLFKAYEEEQASRVLSLDALQKLVDQLRGMGCPSIEKISKRHDSLKEATGALTAAATDYRSDLDAVLEHHQALDEKRLSFAKRAEALNRWVEESLDSLSEVLAVDNVVEADHVQQDLERFQTELADHRAEAKSLAGVEADLDAAGGGHNPYSRFRMDELSEKVAEVDKACEERASRLAAARVRIDDIDKEKKQFAEAAEKALAFIKAEKTALEGTVQGVLVKPDDSDSIALGKEKLAYLAEYSGKAAERAECLLDAQHLYDALMAAGEMDNPYTRQSMPSLTSALDQLERLVRDFSNLVEGQLARAVASITPEQHAELKAAFEHFDKSQDGKLNEVEFTAAMKSLDFTGAEAAFEKYADTTHTVTRDEDDEGPTEERCMSFDVFLTIVLQQYKDKDTMDGLVGAFRTLSNGKETLGPEVLTYREGDTTSLKESDIEFLKRKLDTGAEGGFDFTPFSYSVYGSTAPAPVS
jgi:Ca2+-binding EF-hand superfamily protein